MGLWLQGRVWEGRGQGTQHHFPGTVQQHPGPVSPTGLARWPKAEQGTGDCAVSCQMWPLGASCFLGVLGILRGDVYMWGPVGGIPARRLPSLLSQARPSLGPLP